MEQWRPVADYEGVYEVSDLGRVRSLARSLPDGRQLQGRIRKAVPSAGGYLQVMLCVDSVKRQLPVHRAVLEAFVRPADPGEQARHLDGDQENNRLSNLAWGSAAENAQDTIELGTHHYQKRDSCKWGHLLVAPNLTTATTPGHRACRACMLGNTRARDMRKRKGITIDRHAEADRRYAEMMSL